MEYLEYMEYMEYLYMLFRTLIWYIYPVNILHRTHLGILLVLQYFFSIWKKLYFNTIPEDEVLFQKCDQYIGLLR